MKRLSDILAVKWKRLYSIVVGWVRARLPLGIIVSFLCDPEINNYTGFVSCLSLCLSVIITPTKMNH